MGGEAGSGANTGAREVGRASTMGQPLTGKHQKVISRRLIECTRSRPSNCVIDDMATSRGSTVSKCDSL